MKITRLKYFILITLLNCAFLSSAQFTQFQNLTMADGLSASEVYSLGQDKHGFVWVGTRNGLNIYDGIRFRHFFSLANDDSSIPGNTISAMEFDGDSVWMGTRSGLGLMDVHSKKCITIDLGNNEDIRTLFLEKKENILWVGTNSGLIKYNTQNGTYQEFNTDNSNLSHNIIRSIYKDSDGNLWVGTFDKLNKLPINSTYFEVIDLKLEYRPTIRNNLVLSIIPNQLKNDSVLWIGTETGLVEFYRYTNQMQFFREENSGLSNSSSKTLLKTNSGKLWVGTDFGLGEINPNLEIRSHLHDPYKNNSITNSTVWDIFEDYSGTTWFGTDNGISILSKTNNRFQFYPITFNKGNNNTGYEVRDIIEDASSNFWLATQFGVIKYNPGKQLFETFNSEQQVNRKLAINGTRNITEDSKGRIWIATNGGLVIWNPLTKELENYTAKFNSRSGLRSNYIENIFELKDKTMLINTYEGLHRVVENNENIEFEFIGTMGAISEVHNNFLWSFQGSKLLQTNTTSFERNEEFDFNIKGKKVTPLSSLFSGNNSVWLGVENGLIKYDLISKDYNYYEIKSNISFPLISLLNDDDGNIWAASYSAILKFSTETKEFEIYPSGNDIPISRFIEGCCLKRENGDLIFGGHDGYIKFSPDNITKSNFVSPIKFTQLQISNKNISPGEVVNGIVILKNEISFTPELTLNYASGSFLLEFSSLHFGNRNRIRYAYMLEGEDFDWNYINGDNGQASYSNLHSGKYTFRVKGTNNDGEWNPKETVMHIRIKPPLWASPIFIAFYFLLLVLIAVSIIYYFSNRAKMRSQLKLVRLEKQHSENIAKSRQQFFTNISHEFGTPLSLIIGPAEKLNNSSDLIETDKKYVRIIENNARRLMWLNNQFLDFRKLENKSLSLNIREFGIVEFSKNIYSLFIDKAERKNINYSINSEFEKLEVSMDLRKIETILFNLLSNAFKFTPEHGEITVTISSCELNSESGLCIAVKDSGPGISKTDQQNIFDRFYQAEDAKKMQRGSGIGLTLVHEYTQMHQGKIDLKSTLGEGSEFRILLPLNVNYKTDSTANPKLETSKPLLKPEQKGSVIEQIETSVSGKPLILLLEDEKEISDFIRISLKEGYNVHVAANGKIALQHIAKQLPDLVISDIKMPEMDGIEFTKKFKSNPKTSHIPLILLTGQSEAEKQLEGLKSGADAYITKPFEIDLLEVRVENFLKRSEKLIEFLELTKISKPKEVQLVSQDEKLLERVVNCIEKHISDSDLNIDKLCRQTGMSHSILYRKIKNLTGQTVNEFIRTVRVRRAEQLLRTKKFSVSEVMYETGFSNHSYFSKCFRKLYKMSPKEYINQA